MFDLVLEVMHNLLKTYFKLHVHGLCHKDMLFHILCVQIMFPGSFFFLFTGICFRGFLQFPPKIDLTVMI
jgi:hypothetical protein